MERKITGTLRARTRRWLVAVLLGPLLFFGVLLVWQNVDVQLDSAKAQQSRLTSLVAQAVSSRLFEQESLLLATLRTHHHLMEESRDEQRDVLAITLAFSCHHRAAQVLEGLDLLDENGKEIVRVSRSAVYHASDYRDLSQSEEFLAPKRTGDAHHSRVLFEAATGRPFMKLSLPVQDPRDLTLKGVLVATVDMEFMIEELRAVTLGESGVAYILDQRGRLLSHPNPSLVLRGTEVKIPKDSEIRKGLDGETALIASETIVLGGERMIVVTELPLWTALEATVFSVAAVTAFIVLAILGAVALQTAFRRTVIRPIEFLSRTAEAIRKGDYSRKASLPSGDEIGSLAGSLDDMTERLLETIGFLERKMAEMQVQDEKLVRQNELMTSIMNSLTHPFYVVDAATFEVTLANAASGFGDLSQKPRCHALTHGESRPCAGEDHLCPLSVIAKTMEPVTLEHVHRDDAGNARYLEMHGYPVCDADGRLTHVIEYCHDITARKKLEAEFLQAQKMEAVGQLSGGIAHDFNNLLTVINGYNELIAGMLHDAHAAQPMLKDMRGAGERAATLTRQLLAFSRKQMLIPEIADLNDIVDHMAGILRRVIGEDVSLELHPSPAPCLVKVDRSQLEQVLMNLAVNARAAMPDGGHLVVRIAAERAEPQDTPARTSLPPGDYAHLTVEDDGCGMTPEIKDRIFEPFFTTKGADKGTGLGLSTVYGIVKQHAGAIAVVSEPNRGTAFHIYLPLAKGAKESVGQASETGSSSAAASRCNVMLVEDERSIRKLFADALRAQGFGVFEASNGREALVLLGNPEIEISILVTDVVMPEMGGRELAEAAKATRKELGVLFMSGYANTQALDESEEDGRVHFLQKPITPKDLLAAISTVIAERRDRS